MSFRVITAKLNGSPADSAVLNGALALSKVSGGHIDALFARPDPRLVVASVEEGVYPGFYEEMVEHVEHEWTEIANKALKNFETWRIANDVRELQNPDGARAPSAAWRDAVGTERETIGRDGHLSDIVVTAVSSRTAKPRHDVSSEAALFDTGRPILLIPAVIHIGVPLRTVVVAWNGSAEAFRAVTAAMPILTRAEEVLVYTASEGSVTRAMAENLVAFLAWHGVRASVLPTNDGKANTVEEGLLAATKKTKASLLVMGAYTHSRFRELIFGGVTRHVFDHAALPVLMAH